VILALLVILIVDVIYLYSNGCMTTAITSICHIYVIQHFLGAYHDYPGNNCFMLSRIKSLIINNTDFTKQYNIDKYYINWHGATSVT